jgi:hypothetical protein
MSGLESNYCRNPDVNPETWCYTTNKNKRWTFCNQLNQHCSTPRSNEEIPYIGIAIFLIVLFFGGFGFRHYRGQHVVVIEIEEESVHEHVLVEHH